MVAWHRPSLCLHLLVLLHAEGLPALRVLDDCLAKLVPHGDIEIRAHPALVRFHEVVGVAGALLLYDGLHRLVLLLVDILGLVLLRSLVLVHQVVGWPRVLANGGRPFLDLGAGCGVTFAFGLFFVALFVPFSIIVLGLKNSRLLFLLLFRLGLVLFFCLDVTATARSAGGGIVCARCGLPDLGGFLCHLGVEVWVSARGILRVDQLVLVALDLLDGLLWIEPDPV